MGAVFWISIAKYLQLIEKDKNALVLDAVIFIDPFLFEFLIPLSNSAISLRAAAFFLVVAPRLPDRQQRQRCGIKCTNFRKPKSV